MKTALLELLAWLCYLPVRAFGYYGQPDAAGN